MVEQECGKTTIINLLERLYEPQEGEIRINQKDYRKYNISLIRENIKYVNRKITKEEIVEIFKKLKLHEKMISLPKGYDTNIYENTELLSTGEKQMISFARIMAMSPDVVILDEVTSNLSWEKEELIKNAIEKATKR